MWKKLLKNDDAVLGYFFAFVLAGAMLVFLFAVATPFMVNFTTDMYAASDSIIADSMENIENIQNETIKNRIQSGLQNMQDATEENINYLSFFYQYGWIFIMLVTVFTIFMLARRVVETKSGLGVV
jgi:predicted PurR-regulated permease PerM